ncbi:hypothetical protein [Lactiplantibacillus modestisalitolerans]|uniref:Lipoprotein n=1 Tax=Lactiplantibacillus modestisalitolerans TaxID=1457219 RepID=A0ABV5WSK2_9LACO|nr:hypothetical protein [Lactiplantibacillus modestisalitolerans]
MKKIMRVVSLVGILGLLVVVLVACGNKNVTNSDTSSGYHNSISKGLDAVAENEMDKALAYFDNALTQKPEDANAKTYRNQVQAYVDTNSQLKVGKVQKAMTIITDSIKIKNGAKSLDNKLADLQMTVKADLAEYKKLDKEVTDQLKVTNGNYSSDVLKQCKNIKWDKKPYLSKLKPKVNKLINQSAQDGGSSSSVASTSSSLADTKVNTADRKEAAQMRQNIVQSEPGKWDSAALEQVPNSVIVAIIKKAKDSGGDSGTIANMIAQQYPNIKNSSSDNSDESVDASTYTNKDRADQIRTVLANNQNLSKSGLAAIPDDEIINAAEEGFMSNSDIARTAGTLVQSHPNLKQ